MRDTPIGNATLLKIQNEINEVAQRENELRITHANGNVTTNGVQNGDSNPRILQRAVSTPAISQAPPPVLSGRRFVPNNNTKGVMQKFFKMRGKLTAVGAINTNNNSIPIQTNTYISTEVTTPPPSKALIPSDKPLRKGYVPIQERIQSELREMKNREDELKIERRKSQPDLMAALENSDEENNISRSPSPSIIGKLRPARSMSHLLDEEFPMEINSAPPSLRPARSLAQLCDADDEEIESPRSLIQQWESRIKQSQKKT